MPKELSCENVGILHKTGENLFKTIYKNEAKLEIILTKAGKIWYPIYGTVVWQRLGNKKAVTEGEKGNVSER